MGTALLFGRAGPDLDLSLAFPGRQYLWRGGGVIVLLVWVYYSAQIFLLGAEFTKVWAQHYGSQRNA